MYCEACGSRMNEGTAVCTTCGAHLSEPARRATAEQVRAPEPEFDFAGPKCAVHPGMPIAGACPRCGKPVCIRCAPEAARDNFHCTDCDGLTPAHVKAPADAACAFHPNAHATFICARCGSFACSACAATGPGAEGQCIRCGPAGGILATRGARFGANLLDNFIVALPAVAALFVVAVSMDGHKGGPPTALLLAAVGGFFAGCAAQLVAQVQWGQSLGKRLIGIKVVRRDGSPIELWRLLLLRNLVIQVAGQACGLIGLVDALLIFGNDQRCLHDLLADSIVVVAMKE